MGEIAEAMLNGILCAGCGEYLHCDEEAGFPLYCSEQCAKDCGAGFEQTVGFQSHGYPPNHMNGRRRQRAKRRSFRKPDTPCPHCNKLMRGQQGVRDHIRDHHPERAG